MSDKRNVAIPVAAAERPDNLSERLRMTRGDILMLLVLTTTPEEIQAAQLERA
ncbi:MAG: hypothetical protein OXG04_24160 [Acidobacteria bacterium]|nr:hypothetical protein [Acidobacteriota bacterium]